MRKKESRKPNNPIDPKALKEIIKLLKTVQVKLDKMINGLAKKMPRG